MAFKPQGARAAISESSLRRNASNCAEATGVPPSNLRHHDSMKPHRTRFQLYLPDDIAGEIERLARQPGSSKSAILEEAVAAWFQSRGNGALDDRFAIRLDRIGQAQKALFEKLAYVTEALQTFVQYQLTLTANHAPFDAETAKLGQARAKTFREAVERRLENKRTQEGIPETIDPA